MEVLFPDFPNNSRVWLYPSNRAMTDLERWKIDSLCLDFVQKWAAHGNKLWAGAKTITPYFLVFVVNDALTPPSGCSIDASVRFVKQLGQEMELDFFQRLNIVIENNGNLEQHNYHVLGELLSQNPNLSIYDPLVESLAQLRDSWPCAVAESSLAV